MKNTGLKRGVYKVLTDKDVVVFVGGTTSTLEQVEWNHRNNNPLDGEGATKFREELQKFGSNWTFTWEVLPYICTSEQNEWQTSKMIAKFQPVFN